MNTADPAAQRSLVGAVLSRAFRLTRKIGEGGMGEVYAAEPLEGAGGSAGTTPVAVKIIHREFLTELVVVARFLEEARTCQRLIHPNIVRVFESREAEDGSPYIVMELLEGVPLSAYTQNGGRVPAAQAMPILQGILAGLAAAHAQGIVHRDLKPENVFLTRDPTGHFVVKVLDFGIAKVMDVAGGMGTKTRTGMLLGTPAYMSPEQIKNAKDVDARADLWSAGVMFYEMLTGRVAFPAPTEYARLTAVLTTTPDALELVDPSLAPLSGYVQHALEKDRTQRFQSALEMSRALGVIASNAEGAFGAPPRRSQHPSEAYPLSRLPDVPSLFAPSMRSPVSVGSIATAPAAMVTTSPSVPPRGDSRAPMGKTPGGTLTSPAAPQVADVVPQVLLLPPVQSTGETLPSKDLPILQPPSSRGVSPRAPGGVSAGLVVVLVAAALAAGFLIGFAAGRMI